MPTRRQTAPVTTRSRRFCRPATTSTSMTASTARATTLRSITASASTKAPRRLVTVTNGGSQSANRRDVPAGTTISGHVYGGTGTGRRSQELVSRRTPAGFQPQRRQYTYGEYADTAATAATPSATSAGHMPTRSLRVVWRGHSICTPVLQRCHELVARDDRHTDALRSGNGHRCSPCRERERSPARVYDANNAPITSQRHMRRSDGRRRTGGINYVQRPLSSSGRLLDVGPRSRKLLRAISRLLHQHTQRCLAVLPAESGPPYAGTLNELRSRRSCVSQGGCHRGRRHARCRRDDQWHRLRPAPAPPAARLRSA